MSRSLSLSLSLSPSLSLCVSRRVHTGLRGNNGDLGTYKLLHAVAYYTVGRGPSCFSKRGRPAMQQRDVFPSSSIQNPEAFSSLRCMHHGLVLPARRLPQHARHELLAYSAAAIFCDDVLRLSATSGQYFPCWHGF